MIICTITIRIRMSRKMMRTELDPSIMRRVLISIPSITRVRTLRKTSMLKKRNKNHMLRIILLRRRRQKKSLWFEIQLPILRDLLLLTNTNTPS